MGTLAYMQVPTLEGTYVLGLWASGAGQGAVRDGGV
jgi:hypothetical protein